MTSANRATTMITTVAATGHDLPLVATLHGLLTDWLCNRPRSGDGRCVGRRIHHSCASSARLDPPPGPDPARGDAELLTMTGATRYTEQLLRSTLRAASGGAGVTTREGLRPGFGMERSSGPDTRGTSSAPPQLTVDLLVFSPPQEPGQGQNARPSHERSVMQRVTVGTAGRPGPPRTAGAIRRRDPVPQWRQVVWSEPRPMPECGSKLAPTR